VVVAEEAALAACIEHARDTKEGAELRSRVSFQISDPKMILLTHGGQIVPARPVIDQADDEIPHDRTSLFDLRVDAYSQLLSGNLRRLLRKVFVHHVPATDTQAGALSHHASRDAGNVGDFRTAETKRIAGTHLLRLGAKGKTRGRRCAEADG
jgi:hypothetical protein